jgi:hypothetical protein
MPSCKLRRDGESRRAGAKWRVRDARCAYASMRTFVPLLPKIVLLSVPATAAMPPLRGSGIGGSQAKMRRQWHH